jgi:hypothetical protein
MGLFSSRAQNSPGKPRPADPLVREAADMLMRIEANYRREGSGPGSRFEGLLLEDVQARAVVALVQSQKPEASRQAQEALDPLFADPYMTRLLESDQAAFAEAGRLVTRAFTAGKGYTSGLEAELARLREESPS